MGSRRVCAAAQGRAADGADVVPRAVHPAARARGRPNRSGFVDVGIRAGADGSASALAGRLRICVVDDSSRRLLRRCDTPAPPIQDEQRAERRRRRQRRAGDGGWEDVPRRPDGSWPFEAGEGGSPSQMRRAASELGSPLAMSGGRFSAADVRFAFRAFALLHLHGGAHYYHYYHCFAVRAVCGRARWWRFPPRQCGTGHAIGQAHAAGVCSCRCSATRSAAAAGDVRVVVGCWRPAARSPRCSTRPPRWALRR